MLLFVNAHTYGYIPGNLQGDDKGFWKEIKKGDNGMERVHVSVCVGGRERGKKTEFE